MNDAPEQADPDAPAEAAPSVPTPEPTHAPAESAVVESDAAETAPAEPVAPEPVAPEPVATEPAVTEPAVTEAAAPVDAPPVPTPATIRSLGDAAPVPAPPAVPVPAEQPEPAPVDMAAAAEWGRVDEAGTVFVRTADGEREIGSWQVGSPIEALEFYRRRYEGLAVEVDLLEHRIRKADIPEKEARATIERLRAALTDAAALGDLAALGARVDAVAEVARERAAQARAARAQAQAEARKLKDRIIADAEAVAAGNEWRAGAEKLQALLAEWKAAPRLDRKSDDELWARFSGARSAFGKRRKAHYGELTATRDAAKAAKEALIAKAESLAGSTDWGPTAEAYRTLMREWKDAGRASREVDDALWARFRGAQDEFFAARNSTFAARDAERADKAKARDAERSADRAAATEARARSEAAQRDQDRRASSSRAAETVEALRAAVAGYEAKADKARAAGNAKALAEAEDAAKARREWLAEAERSLADLS